MKKIFAALFLLASLSTAQAATAYFTGEQVQVQTVTYQMAWRCTYQYNGQHIYQIFMMSCPSSIQVF